MMRNARRPSRSASSARGSGRSAAAATATDIESWAAASAGPTADSAIIARITTRSCTIRNPTAIRPWSESISRLSLSSFTMMIVLENVSATAM